MEQANLDGEKCKRKKGHPQASLLELNTLGYDGCLALFSNAYLLDREPKPTT